MIGRVQRFLRRRDAERYAWMFVREGNEARDARNWVAARDAYGQALQRNPSLAPVWVQYGHALKESGDLSSAEDAYRRAITLEANVADTHFQLGGLLNRLGRFDEAGELFERAVGLDISLEHAQRELRAFRSRQKAEQRAALRANSDLPSCLRGVVIGTTGLCNASCVHCPTGKAETASAPRMPMPMKLFQQIFESIVVELELPINHQIAFGLFGDGLVDPLVVERVEFLRSLLPEHRISVNTNGAAFNPQRHGKLAKLGCVVSLHVESLVPETYDSLMQPLRLERVLPKIEQIMEMFPHQVHVSVPVSRRNLEELPAIKAFFFHRNAMDVVFDPLSSRCAEDQTLFRALAINPHPVRCAPEALEDLIVDCDGLVLTCCQDFRRLEPIGDLTKETLAEVLINARRKKMRDIFSQRRHAEVSTCSRCYGDLRGHVAVI
jgi:MoaA/NifB/PqqE/SkfB family radical SAM enzyme